MKCLLEKTKKQILNENDVPINKAREPRLPHYLHVLKKEETVRYDSMGVCSKWKYSRTSFKIGLLNSFPWISLAIPKKTIGQKGNFF